MEYWIEERRDEMEKEVGTVSPEIWAIFGGGMFNYYFESVLVS